MNRRDMMIAAVLINVGLLVVLFVVSIKREQKEVAVVTGRTVADVHQQKEPVPQLSVAEKSRFLPETPALAKKSLPQHRPVTKVLQQKEEKKEAHKLAVTASPALNPTQSFSHKIVVVKKGQVLEKIAKMHGVTVEEILKLNQLKTTRLQIGQQLKVPPPKTAKPAAKQQKATGKIHIVKEGENPWTIAKQYHIKVEELLYLNQLTEKEAKKLRPGQSLRVQ